MTRTPSAPRAARRAWWPVIAAVTPGAMARQLVSMPSSTADSTPVTAPTAAAPRG